MKSIIHRVKYTGLHSVLCTIPAFWMVTDAYSAENESQIVNLKAINRCILTPLLCHNFSCYLIEKLCYHSENRVMPL